ncbi:ParA family protein [Vibrio coralliilyticus]|uniref:ParA family protein n=1 Tax=Vibrio coralliilyticus TaxID=190893 RepID=UPI001E382CCF|nr:ParA family protein [Vibrio coralliilyticus]MCC2525026.1 ParA family protein [Vibrio coralliilyticus]
MDQQQTATLFANLQDKGREYLARSRNRIEKEERSYQNKEVHAFFGLDPRTTKKYALEACGIADIKNLTLTQMCDIRDALPQNLRVALKFERKENQHCQVIAVQNQKGGVGKSTHATTIATGLALEYHQEYRIGFIDLDAQHNASSFWLDNLESDEHVSAGELIIGEYELDEGETEKEFFSSCFLPTSIPNLRILPASQLHRSYEFKFHQQLNSGNREDPYRRLKHIIDTVSDEFDIIIIDTPPSSGFVTLNAYFAATAVVIPVQFNEVDVEATCSYFNFIPDLWQMMADLGHPGYDFVKIQATNYDENSNSELDIKNKFLTQFGSYTYGAQFFSSEAVKVCNNLNSTLFEMSASQYPMTKKSFQRAQTNAGNVVSELHHDILNAWSSREGL